MIAPPEVLRQLLRHVRCVAGLLIPTVLELCLTEHQLGVELPDACLRYLHGSAHLGQLCFGGLGGGAGDCPWAWGVP